MINKILQFVFVFMVFLTAACVKETYNMDKLSSEVHLTPSMALSAINGKILFSDMVESDDTVVFDQNNFVKLVFKEDDIIDLKLEDFYDLDDMVSYSQSYTIGELTMEPFSRAIQFSVGPVAALIGPTPVTIPAFGSTDLGEQVYSFSNFQNAVFSSGFLNITILNNLPADLNSISLRLYSGTGGSRTLFVPLITIPPIPMGTSYTYSINLANKSLINPISAAIVLSGSPGNSTPVLITQSNSKVQVTITGSALRVKSGTVILPPQAISTLDNQDIITFDPGSGVELDELKVLNGNATFHIQSTSTIPAIINITLPTALRNGIAVSEIINVGAVSSFNGTIPFSNTVVDLGTDAIQPYNRIPMTYSISVNSNNSMVTFSSTDEINFDLKLQNPEFDYVKGYFGKMTESIEPDSIDLEIDEILRNLKGTFLISNPSIKLNYKNSFGIPLKFKLNAVGRRDKSKVDLALDTLTMLYPEFPAARDVSGTFTIDKSNSSLPQIISLPPEVIRFSGSAKMNSGGDPSHLRNNYVFGNSRVIGSIEVEVPMEFSVNNMQYADTVDNFMKDDSGDSEFDFENFGLFRVDLNATNGFPLGVSIKMSLYDSVTKTIKATVDATDLLKPATVDNTGKSNGTTESSTSIEFTQDFFKSVNNADKIIFSFTLNTTDNKVIKIYSDYSIEFSAAVVVKADINLK